MATAVSAAVSLSSSSKSTTSLPTRSSIISPERISFFKVPIYCRNVYTSGRVIEKVSKKDDEGVLVNKCKPKEPYIGRCLLNPGETWHMVFSTEADESLACGTLDRRKAIVFAIAQLAICGAASASEFADMPALKGKDYGKTKMRYPDYVETKSGLQYKDLRVGNGPTPRTGETVVVDWDGYTIGYYGRIFEARNKTKGGSFEGGDKDFFKFKIGSQEVIPAFEEAVSGMAVGGIRRIIVPPELGYPEYDYNKQGPRPTTFSGQRALDFVLRNQGLIDKTLLFDIELLKINPN